MSWKALEEIEARIERLRGRAEKSARPLPAQSRELVSVLYQEVSFLQNDLSEQRQTFYNGDRDTLVIQRLAATVSIELAGIRFSLEKTAIGWALQGWRWALFDDPGTGFDFSWNYVVNSRQSLYSRDACSSDMLVGLDKGQMLDWRVPLVIPKSESIEFRVQPLRFPFPGTQNSIASTRYYVGFHGLGYRSMP